MPDEFEIRTEAERFIHNDLSNCAWFFQKAMEQKIKSEETDGIYFDMMGSLIFSAFSIEAKVNFVGWKVLGKGWPERSSLQGKIELLIEVLKLKLDWGERPLQTVAQLKRFRDTIAHGKPVIIDKIVKGNIEPSVWDALKGQWEKSVTPDFVMKCKEDENKLWDILLNKAGIEKYETITHGGHTLSKITT